MTRAPSRRRPSCLAASWCGPVPEAGMCVGVGGARGRREHGEPVSFAHSCVLRAPSHPATGAPRPPHTCQGKRAPFDRVAALGWTRLGDVQPRPSAAATAITRCTPHHVRSQHQQAPQPRARRSLQRDCVRRRLEPRPTCRKAGRQGQFQFRARSTADGKHGGARPTRVAGWQQAGGCAGAGTGWNAHG